MSKKQFKERLAIEGLAFGWYGSEFVTSDLIDAEDLTSNEGESLEDIARIDFMSGAISGF